jgi:hypothetical protein
LLNSIGNIGNQIVDSIDYELEQISDDDDNMIISLQSTLNRIVKIPEPTEHQRTNVLPPAERKRIHNRAAGLAWCLLGAWWPGRPCLLSRLNFENLAWPDPSSQYIRPGPGQARPRFSAW